MERVVSVLVIFTLCMFAISCEPTARVVDTGGPSILQAQQVPATGARLRLAVMDFENKTRYDVGRGMTAMMTSALFRSDKFIILEREELGDVLLEQQLAATGVVSRETSVASGEVEGAQILVYGTVTDFEPGQRGMVSAFGGVQQSHVAIDLKLVDARTSRVVAATTVEGKATDVSLSTEALKYVGASPLYFLEIWHNTPVDGAIRICINEGVGFVVNKLDGNQGNLK